MADIWAKRKDVDKICKKAEKKYPKGMVLDIYIVGSNDEHVIYCVSKGVEHYAQKKMEKAAKRVGKKAAKKTAKK